MTRSRSIEVRTTDDNCDRQGPPSEDSSIPRRGRRAEHSHRVSNEGGSTNEFFLASVLRFRAFPDTRARAEPVRLAVVNLIQVDCPQVSTLTFSFSALGRPYRQPGSPLQPRRITYPLPPSALLRALGKSYTRAIDLPSGPRQRGNGSTRTIEIIRHV